ncbi:MAG: 6-bladed beta-propeller, partial [Acidobacteriota bacterium]|nr:6-bladed beta-propeller [Acidobacteriota bacterium]
MRGVEAAGDGTIFVLDYQAAEVRAFGPDGAYLRTVATRGEGPGEIREANGFKLVGDSILWIQDHGQWQMIG